MAYGFPGGNNTFVPSHEASGSLVLGYSRNPTKFAVNRYTQYTPVKKSQFYVLNWNSEEGDRVPSPNYSAWADGQEAPTGVGETESFEFQLFQTIRRAYPFTIGQKAIDQADWNLLAASSAVVAQKAMTERTSLVYTALNNAGFTSATATALGGGKFNAGTPATPYMKLGLYKAAAAINAATMGVVGVEDLAILLNPNTAYQIGASQEITDNLKYVAGLTYVLDGVPVQVDPSWGLPSRIYGFESIVDQTTINTTIKPGGTPAYIIPDGVIFMISRAGGLVGIEGAPSWSTVQAYFYEEMTVESMYDVNNRLTRGRVVSDYVIEVPDQGIKAGYKITSSI